MERESARPADRGIDHLETWADAGGRIWESGATRRESEAHGTDGKECKAILSSRATNPARGRGGGGGGRRMKNHFVEFFLLFRGLAAWLRASFGFRPSVRMMFVRTGKVWSGRLVLLVHHNA